MPDLSFQIEKAEPQRFTVAPTLLFKLRIANAAPDETIHSVALRCQIQLEVTRRQYTPEDKAPARSLWRARSLGPDSENHALDPRQRGRPCVSGYRRGRSSRAVHIRFQCGRNKIFSWPGRRRCSAEFFFSGTVFYADDERIAAGRSDSLGQRSSLPPAGESLGTK